MELFQKNHIENVKAITRIDKNGYIVHTYPLNNKVIGKNVLSQKHNKYIYKEHRPVISDVFKTLQGYRAIAYAYPVFKNKQYAGCITILLSFSAISKKYIESIKIRESGYAWMISEEGVELFCPVPGHIGKTVLETSGQYPSIMNMGKNMKLGKEGETVYFYNRIKGRKTERVKKYAVYYPIKIANTHWSIVIATPENEVIGLMQGFINNLAVIFFILFTGGIVIIFYGYRTISLAKEVKQRKNTEIELLAVKLYLDNVFNSMPDILIGMDNTGIVENMNHRAEDFSGVLIAEGIGSNIFDVLPQFTHEFSSILADKDNKVSINRKKIYDALGEPRVFQIYSYNLLNDNVSGIVVRIEDITESEEKERQLVQSQKMETIGNLAGGLAHDFNNVLGGIIGSLDLLSKALSKEDLQGDEKITKYLNILRTSSFRAGDMVKQLLSLSRKNKLQKHPMNLNGAIKNVVEICQNSFPKSVSIDAQYLVADSIIRADQTGIEQVLLNVMVNASHSMTLMREEGEKQGGVVKISIEKIFSDDTFIDINHSAEKNISYFQITISDTGIGFDEELKQNIFEPFFTTKAKSEGTGLGLSMVYNIVNTHNGLIDCSSKIGEGTTFNIFFPEWKGDNNHIKDSILEVNTLEGSGLILIIDDEDVIREIAKSVIKLHNYKVLEADNGLSGVEIFKEKHDEISAVLLDMSMPGLSGLEVFIELKKIKKDVKVLLSSGFREDERVNKALELGVAGFISKPYGTDRLLKALSEVIDDTSFGSDFF